MMIRNLATRLEHLRNVAVGTNIQWAKKLGINPSASITCVKPSGTVSQLVDSSSGIHARHSPFYIRSVRADKKDPLVQMMIDAGFPHEDDRTQPDHNSIFSWPIKAPDNAVFRNDMTAIQQLDHWLLYQRHWCEHKPSCTVSVKEHEWLQVGAWVYEHFDEVSGISFLPFSDHIYAQAPYQDCDEETYIKALEEMPKKIDWNLLTQYENTDQTTGVQELSCTSGFCEI